MRIVLIIIIGFLLSVRWNPCLSQTNQIDSHEDVVARFKVQTEELAKHLVRVCDKSLKRYKSFNKVQEAFAALSLSGFEEVLIRPRGQRGPASLPASYDLLVPHDSAIRAAAALRSAHVCELKRFEEHSNAIPVMSFLLAHQVEATIRHLKKDERSTVSPVIAVFVRQSDMEAARALLTSR